MAQTFDWSDKNHLRHRAWDSVKEFFGKEEKERPLNPDLVTEETELPEGTFPSPRASDDSFEDPNAERVHRRTEQRKISENHSTVWPG